MRFPQGEDMAKGVQQNATFNWDHHSTDPDSIRSSHGSPPAVWTLTLASLFLPTTLWCTSCALRRVLTLIDVAEERGQVV